ncbi:glycosyltransferase family 39 protein [Streptomyces avermitilis]|uniref:glycosyltransferase family 39 protein n=1 Tax=Streptomyces avermitilis TaxID=33903 RepID=UPI00339EEF02
MSSLCKDRPPVARTRTEAASALVPVPVRLLVPVLVSVLVPVLVMLVLGLWGLDRGGMWRDEAVTFEVAHRSVPQIWRLLHGVDAVHGLYYLVMHTVLSGWAVFARPGEVVLRLPSVLGAAATAGLVAALGVRLCRPRVGLWAGLLYAVTPLAGHYAQEGRSYALVSAGVAASTLLLVRAVRGGGWWRYGVVAGVTCVLHEFAVLALLAHACALALARVRGRVWRAWGCAVGGVALVLLPVVVVSQGQAAQVAWLGVPDLRAAGRLLEGFAGAPGLLLVPCLVLAGVGVRGGPRGELSLGRVALPLVAVPPVVLLTVSQVRPFYDERYVLYALAGMPLLVASGADRVAGAMRRLRAGGRTAPARAPLLGVLTIGLVLVSRLPVLEADRDADRRPDNLAAVSRVAGRVMRPGDPLLFLPAFGRRAALTYPEEFRRTRDVALSVPAPVDGSLYGREVGADELRRRLGRLDRVWVVAQTYALSPGWSSRSPVERLKRTVMDEEFEPRAEFVRKGSTLRLYVRRPWFQAGSEGPGRVRPSASAARRESSGTGARPSPGRSPVSRPVPPRPGSS